MGEIVMVRHGQANTGATTEEDYDRLSPLGHQQSAWLGTYFADHRMRFDKVIAGTLNRHAQTHDSMATAPDRQTDPRLNEIRYFDLAEELHQLDGTPTPTSPEDFAAHLPVTLDAWRSGRLGHHGESFDDFQTRVWSVIDEAMHGPDRVLLVTSGGVISFVLARVLGLQIQPHADTLLQIRNSSFHVLRPFHGRLHLHQFNATPHLAQPDRHHALTFV